MYHAFEREGNRLSCWQEIKLSGLSNLTKSCKSQVCVIGAGIAGLTVAYQLLKSGFQVTVVDDGMIGSGESGRTTAHLMSALDDRFFNIAKVFGREGAMLAAESHCQAINFIEQLVSDEHIECDFKRLKGYLFLSADNDKSFLEKEYRAAQSANLEVQLLAQANLKGINLGPALCFPNQGQLHPTKYLHALAQLILSLNGQIFINTKVQDIKAGPPASVIIDDKITITSEYVVIATNAPIYDKALIFAKQAPNRTAVIGALIAKDSIESALFWDTADPYHYTRLQSYNDTHDLLIVGGEDYRTGKILSDPNLPFTNLEQWARLHFPQMENTIYQWSGQVLEPNDHLAYIGQMSTQEPHIYVVTGDSGMGMTHGTIAGLIIPDLMMGKNNPWSDLYSPRRSIFKGGRHLLMNGLDTAKNYSQYLSIGKNEVSLLPKNQGTIKGCGLKKLAIYRDESNKLHEFSAICPHLNGLVKWNDTEKSWDCEAHGSRFSPCGEVINGPASKPLNKK
jgi:glycine/D-amino acid oxidase-like deaminating enzyme/nitrite reductase/ring-hydroxylating ferredoxin subunit